MCSAAKCILRPTPGRVPTPLPSVLGADFGFRLKYTEDGFLALYALAVCRCTSLLEEGAVVLYLPRSLVAYCPLECSRSLPAHIYARARYEGLALDAIVVLYLGGDSERTPLFVHKSLS